MLSMDSVSCTRGALVVARGLAQAASCRLKCGVTGKRAAQRLLSCVLLNLMCSQVGPAVILWEALASAALPT